MTTNNPPWYAGFKKRMEKLYPNITFTKSLAVSKRDQLRTSLEAKGAKLKEST